jgi:hypothetical protein
MRVAYRTLCDGRKSTERLRKEDEMAQNRMAALTASVVFAMCGTVGTMTFAQTSQPTLKTQAAPRDSGASMVKPPEAAPGSNGSSNPDTMPIKRPREPANDRMMHEPPASGANAK